MTKYNTLIVSWVVLVGTLLWLNSKINMEYAISLSTPTKEVILLYENTPFLLLIHVYDNR